MRDDTDGLRTIRILLTAMSLEYFGPALRDSGPSHALNPDWVGHARLHIVWFIVLLVLSGTLNLFLVWGSRSSRRDLVLALLMQGCVFLGFVSAATLAPLYGGVITLPATHTKVLGIDENVLFFSVMSVVWAVTAGLLRRAHRTDPAAHESPLAVSP